MRKKGWLWVTRMSPIANRTVRFGGRPKKLQPGEVALEPDTARFNIS
ncbi:hypothetical protein [Bacteroides pyogenes]|nr:hypothetical protein [Bacteroides pyogenes]